MQINKQDEKLFQELLKKYKQGLISGLIQGNNVTLTSTGCRNKVISSINDGNSEGGDFTGVEVDGTTITGDGLNTPLSAIFNQEGKYIISGGSSWSGTGLVYDVSILNYFFNGIKPTTQAQVTLDASDATYDRFDAIVVDEDGVISIIKGTAEANPITPTIPENQLLVQYILVGAGTVTPAITQEIIHADEPTTNWTASNYTTAGGVVGTTDFAATTPTPFQGADCILNTRDGRTGVRFVRDTAINLADYTYVALRVFIPTALATNKSLVLRFENSAGVLIGTGINLFSYGINRNLIGVWQMAYVPTYAFGAINSIKGLKIILSGGTVGVTAQWAIDYVLLSTGSTPSANLPTITVSENGVAKGNTENIDFIDGNNTTVDVVKDLITGKIKVKVNSLGGLFPNGIELVTSSRDFQSSDIGKILVVTTSNVHLTMPLGTTFGIGTIFGLKFLGNLTDCDFESTNGTVVKPLITVEDGEFITFSTGFSGSNSSVGAISGQYILDNGIWKTDLKYLYDQSQNAIPLSGTEIGKPVTGDIEFEFDSFKGVVYKDENVNYGFVIADTPIMYYDGTSMGHNKIQLRTTETGFVVSKESGVNAFVGFTALEDLSANITDLDYTQKKYVDTKLSRQVFNINTSTTADNISNIDYVYNISGGSTLTLPTAVGNTNEYKINNVDTIPCDIVADGVETIDGLSLFTLISQYDSITLISDGASWVAGGGGSSLSGLTAATATNTINNGAYSQEWQWNSQTNAPMLKLSSTSTGALTGGNGLEINLTGTLVNNVQTTYAAKFINTRYSPASTPAGAYFQGNPAIQTLGDISIGGNTSLRWNNGNFDGCYIQSLYNAPVLEIGSVGQVKMVAPSGVYLKSNIFNPFNIEKAGPGSVFSIGAQSETKQASIFGGGLANSSQYASGSSTLCVIERDLGKLNFSANVGLTPFTYLPPLTYQMCVDGTNNNVAIGKGNTAGDASAKLEVVSTTQGFLPPRMTATQASAIVSPAQGLMLFVTDTNGTFTGVGWWGYNGANWEKLNN